MLKTLREQKFVIETKMNDEFKPQIDVLLSGINKFGDKESHEIINVEFFTGTAKTKDNDIYILERKAIESYAELIMNHKTDNKINDLSDLEYCEIIAINQKDRSILYSEEHGNKRILNVGEYQNTPEFKNFISDYKNNFGYDENYKGTLTHFKDVEVNKDYPISNTAIREEYGEYILRKETTIDNYLGNIKYVEMHEDIDEIYNSSKTETVSILIESDNKRELISNINGKDFTLISQHLKVELDEDADYEEISARIINEINGELSTKYLKESVEVTHPDIKNFISDASIKDGKFIGMLNNEQVEFPTSNLSKIDGQIYVDTGASKVQVVSINQDYLDNNKISSIDDFFLKANNLENKLGDIAIEKYDILKESTYNANTKKFEEKFALVYDDKVIPLNNKAILSLDNNFLQVGNDTYFLKSTENSKLETKIIESSQTCTVSSDNKKITIGDKTVTADIIDNNHKVAFKKGTIYTIDGNGLTPVGADPLKPEQASVNYVSPKINDLNTDKLNNLGLKIRASEKIDDWEIERKGGFITLTGYTKDGPVNLPLKALREDSLGLNRHSVNRETVLIPRAYVGDKIYDLGFPSEKVSKQSAYDKPMSHMIEQHGFGTIAIDMNTKMSNRLEYVDPQPAIRNVPMECFVVMDDKLYLKINNTLINNGAMLDFNNEQYRIQAAFTSIPSDTRLIKSMLENEVSVGKDDGKYILMAKDKTGEETRLEINPSSNYENDRYASVQNDKMIHFELG